MFRAAKNRDRTALSGLVVSGFFLVIDSPCTTWISRRKSRGLTDSNLEFSISHPSYADARPVAAPPDFSTRRFVLPCRHKFGFKFEFC